MDSGACLSDGEEGAQGVASYVATVMSLSRRALDMAWKALL
jgi:hypothetical protein